MLAPFRPATYKAKLVFPFDPDLAVTIFPKQMGSRTQWPWHQRVAVYKPGARVTHYLADLTQHPRHGNPPNPCTSILLKEISENPFGTTFPCAKLRQEVVFLMHQGIFVDRHGNVRVVT